ncbi:MAG TPA: TorF family putative porin [Steroidobacteraceae bacterium]|nr:TorF family putative porin [Steroidobacteraceae bacterium]
MRSAPRQHHRGSLALLACVLLGARLAHADVPTPWSGWSLGGSLAVTSDYIYRGVSESDGHGAVQGDAHLGDASGNFLGVWASSRDRSLEPDAAAVLDLYLGHRFDLSASWSLTLAGRSHYFLGASEYEPSDDYQELSATVGYLDRAAFTVTAIPNAVRYWNYTRLSRAPAYVTDGSLQYLIGHGVFLTGGAGYYYSSGTGPGTERATGYLYGNAGLAYEFAALRLDVGYFFAQQAARRSFPYPIASSRLAATLAWRF